jgi:hypothetical protein
MVIIIGIAAGPVGAGELDESLSMFAELIGKQWEAYFEEADEPIKLYMSREPIIGGAAIEMKGWASASDMTRCNIYYRHRARKQVAFLAMTSNGYVATGTVQLQIKALIFIGQQVWPDGSVHDTMSRGSTYPTVKCLPLATVRTVMNGCLGHKIFFEITDSG